MTKDKALLLALEALESLLQPDNCEHGYWWEDCPNDECEKVKDMKAITAIKEALAKPDDLDVWKVRALQAEAVIEKFMAQPEQEPVAYDKTEMNCFIQDLYDKKMQEGKHGHYETMFHVVHQAIKRVSPKRTWVGLTNDEVNNFAAGCHLGNSVQGAIYKAEAKLRSKNNG
jgi:hypothetical protein